MVQHVAYVPFREVFIEERNQSWNTPYLFNGKELDEETGLYYYGARYYNPRESVWLSTDPLSGYNPVFEQEHYIDGQHNGGGYNSGNLNAYTYQNLVIYVDPNGKQTKNGFVAGLKDGFVGTFKAGYKLVTQPVKTLKETVSNYSWEDYEDVLGNSFTLGQYDYFKATYKAATGDFYGARRNNREESSRSLNCISN
nr:RHS repeat-associated core domain-containing protein [Apibacter adventoris]